MRNSDSDLEEFSIQISNFSNLKFCTPLIIIKFTSEIVAICHDGVNYLFPHYFPLLSLPSLSPTITHDITTYSNCSHQVEAAIYSSEVIAQATCTAQSGHLAYITNAAENDAVYASINLIKSLKILKVSIIKTSENG